MTEAVMDEEQIPKEEEETKENGVVSVTRGTSPNDIWFEVVFESKYWRHPKEHKYTSRFIFRNADIKDICTELKGDVYEKQVVVVVSTKGRTYTFNEAIGKKVMEAFRMVNCVAAIEE